MKINRKIKIIAGSIIGIFVLLFVVLVAHIATARRVENPTIQVSRIDFAAPIDASQAAAITADLHAIAGVKSDIIIKRNVVVYFHDNRVADSKKVYDALMAKGHYNAQRFVLPSTLASKPVCPVMNHNSFYYKFSKTIQRIF